MVDFSNKLGQKNVDKIVDPLNLYESLDRASDKGPLRPAQEAILKHWHDDRRKERDLILKLHTGQGKTLIGLLMLQSLLNEGEGPAVYLCPNKYLIRQTCVQAKQFGVPFCTADTDLPHEFTNGNSILVTSIQKLFNGISRFGIGNRSLSVASVLMDDCHACIDSIRDAFVIHLRRGDAPYSQLVDLFSDALQEQGMGTFAEIKKGDFGSSLPVAYWVWSERQEEVIKILSKSSDLDCLKYVWPIMRDRIAHCLCLISGQRIEIVPYLPPLQLFGSYWNAKHRIFMSATVTDDSFLVKGLQLSADAIRKPLIFAKEKWSGEKMVLIPSLLDDSLDREAVVGEYGASRPGRQYGVLALTPAFKHAEEWKDAGAIVAKPENIESEVERLKCGDGSVPLVAASRYDGIDLPDDACRILILDSLPRAQSLSDRYTEQCRSGSSLTATRTARMIEQGLGRSVRGEKDYSVVIITGADLVKELRSRHFRNHLSDQTKTQIELGLEIAEMGRAEIAKGNGPFDVLGGLIEQCLKRNASWKSFYVEQMDKLSPAVKESATLGIFQAELEAQQHFQRGEVDRAVKTLQKLIDSELKDGGDRAWYIQEMARFTASVSAVEANRLQLAAYRQNAFLLKPRDGIQVTRLEVNQKRASGVISWLRQFDSPQELVLAVEDITGRLQFGVEYDAFEGAFDDLGKALGFSSERPDKIWKAGPDNLWCLSDGEYFLVECKSEVKLDRDAIYKEESGQMNNACAWFNDNYPGAKVHRVMIIPTQKCGEGAGFVEAVQIMRKAELKKLVKQFKAFVSEFRVTNLRELTDQRIQELLEVHGLSVDAIVTDFSKPSE